MTKCLEIKENTSTVFSIFAGDAASGCVFITCVSGGLTWAVIIFSGCLFTVAFLSEDDDRSLDRDDDRDDDREEDLECLPVSSEI